MNDLDVARGERAHVVFIHSDDPDDLTTSLFLARCIARDPRAHMFVIAHTQRFGGRQAAAMRAKDREAMYDEASRVFLRALHTFDVAEALRGRLHLFSMGLGSEFSVANDGERSDGPSLPSADPRAYLPTIKTMELQAAERRLSSKGIELPDDYLRSKARGRWSSEWTVGKLVEASQGGKHDEDGFFAWVSGVIHGKSDFPRLQRSLRRFSAVELVLAGGMGPTSADLLLDDAVPWCGARIMAGSLMTSNGSSTSTSNTGNSSNGLGVTSSNGLKGLNKRWYQTTNAYISDPRSVEALFSGLLPRVISGGGTVVVMTGDAARGSDFARKGKFGSSGAAAGEMTESRQAGLEPGADNMVYEEEDLTGRVMLPEPDIAAIYGKWSEMTRRGVHVIFDDVLVLAGSTIGETPAATLARLSRFADAEMCDVFLGAEPTTGELDSGFDDGINSGDGDKRTSGAVGSEATHGIVGLLPTGAAGKAALEALAQAGGRSGDGRRSLPWSVVYCSSTIGLRKRCSGVVAITGATREMRRRYEELFLDKDGDGSGNGSASYGPFAWAKYGLGAVTGLGSSLCARVLGLCAPTTAGDDGL